MPSGRKTAAATVTRSRPGRQWQAALQPSAPDARRGLSNGRRPTACSPSERAKHALPVADPPDRTSRARWEKEDPDFEAAPRLGMFGLAPEGITVQTATSYCDWHLIPDTNQMEAGRHAVLAPLAVTGGRCLPRRSRGQPPAAPGPNASASP